MERRHNENLNRGIEARFLAQVLRRAHTAGAKHALPVGVRKALQLATHKRKNVGLRPHAFSANQATKWTGERSLGRWAAPRRRGSNFPANGLIFLSSLALSAGPFVHLLPGPSWFAEAILPHWPLPSQTTALRSREALHSKDRLPSPFVHALPAKQNRIITKDNLAVTARAGSTGRASTNAVHAYLSGSPRSAIRQRTNRPLLNISCFAENAILPFMALRFSQAAMPAQVRFDNEKESSPVFRLPKRLDETRTPTGDVAAHVRTRGFSKTNRDDAPQAGTKQLGVKSRKLKREALTMIGQWEPVFARQSWFDRRISTSAGGESMLRKPERSGEGHARTGGSANLEFPFSRRLPHALRSSTRKKSFHSREVLTHEAEALVSLATETATSTIMIDPVFLMNRVQSYYDAQRSLAMVPDELANAHVENEATPSFNLRRKFPASPVRVHTDAKAGAAAQALHAEAFTFGRDIFFAPGRFDLSTPRGLALMGHELVHVKQHDESPQDFQMRSSNSAQHEKLEHEALATEKMVLQNLTKPGKAFKAEPLEYVRSSTPSQSGGMKAEEGRNLGLGATAVHADAAPMTTPGAAPAMPAMDVEQMAEQVYHIIARKLREEKAMRGA